MNQAYSRIGGIDYGAKRVGIALSDPLRITCRPFDTYINDDMLIMRLAGLTKKEDIRLWVIGFPTSSITEEVKEAVLVFEKNLKEATGCDTILQDESFSSRRGTELMIEAGMKKGQRAVKGNLDKFAAYVLLKDYMDQHTV